VFLALLISLTLVISCPARWTGHAAAMAGSGKAPNGIPFKGADAVEASEGQVVVLDKTGTLPGPRLCRHRGSGLAPGGAVLRLAASAEELRAPGESIVRGAHERGITAVDTSRSTHPGHGVCRIGAATCWGTAS
jgi:cation transport ATPase